MIQPYEFLVTAWFVSGLVLWLLWVFIEARSLKQHREREQREKEIDEWERECDAQDAREERRARRRQS